ncbi:hypothetical protein [Actinomadura macrotermitis]|uniref:Uncharacterized protein n=1 Tax=Actinomadura macrotermitis TaxID=2585200 RepID=A0A7K0C1Y9_9ACTN|nr:hypothetical protein [Actinomadura macrotermitis]MQY07467.1 hypothetical protein [Actinomadura macrotermitis]
MSDERAGHGPGPQDAELLLAGGRVPGHERLAGLLADAAAPAPPGPVPGEDAAVAAFRAARPLPARAARWGGRLAAKVTAVVCVTFAAGGVAVAAGTGNLPGQAPEPSHGRRHTPAPGHGAGSGRAPEPAPRPRVTGTAPAGPPPSPGLAPSPSPHPGWKGKDRENAHHPGGPANPTKKPKRSHKPNKPDSDDRPGGRRKTPDPHKVRP